MNYKYIVDKIIQLNDKIIKKERNKIDRSEQKVYKIQNVESE